MLEIGIADSVRRGVLGTSLSFSGEFGIVRIVLSNAGGDARSLWHGDATRSPCVMEHMGYSVHASLEIMHAIIDSMDDGDGCLDAEFAARAGIGGHGVGA